MTDPATSQDTGNAPALSIVIPALNEQDNVAPLVQQVSKAMTDGGIDAELIIIDDGSTDQTLTNLKTLQAEHPFLRVLHRPEPRGQSAAMHAGIQAARGRCIATLDADLQNDPADLPVMLAKIDAEQVDMVPAAIQGDAPVHAGLRSHARREDHRGPRHAPRETHRRHQVRDGPALTRAGGARRPVRGALDDQTLPRHIDPDDRIR